MAFEDKKLKMHDDEGNLKTTDEVTLNIKSITGISNIKVTGGGKVLFEHPEQVPINPETNQVYFEVRPDGWGDGWKTGEASEFDFIDDKLVPIKPKE